MSQQRYVTGRKNVPVVFFYHGGSDNPSEAAEMSRRMGRKTLLFVDEIHRFNKAQQDAFLPYVEKGSIILIGATTENPYFEVNSALISRSSIFELKPTGKGR